ncbi:MAG TPA: SCO family protein [Terriglobales bacterium]|nr:SCO family protein [Terriglobales bacterium]
MRSKSRFFNSIAVVALLGLLLTLAPAHLHAQIRGPMSGGIMTPPANQRPPGLQFVGIDQHLNAEVPVDLRFRDETGRAVTLADYFGHGRPVILNLGYYQCPMLCSEILQGLVGSMKALTFNLGQDFDVVTVSFDPSETPEMAAAKKRDIMKRYGRPNTDQGWHFLTGQADQINALTRAVGYQYQFDPKTEQYAHAAAIVMLTPDHHVSGYFYGVEFSPKDLRLGLVQASQNKIGNLGDQVLLYCYHYDPRTGKYGAVISNILKLAGVVTILILGIFMFVMFRNDRRSALASAHISGGRPGHDGLRRVT